MAPFAAVPPLPQPASPMINPPAMAPFRMPLTLIHTSSGESFVHCRCRGRFKQQTRQPLSGLQRWILLTPRQRPLAPAEQETGQSSVECWVTWTNTDEFRRGSKSEQTAQRHADGASTESPAARARPNDGIWPPAVTPGGVRSTTTTPAACQAFAITRIVSDLAASAW